MSGVCVCVCVGTYVCLPGRGVGVCVGVWCVCGVFMCVCLEVCVGVVCV